MKRLSDYQHNPCVWHQLNIALKTVKYPDNPVLALLGGPTVEEAQATLKRYGLR